MEGRSLWFSVAFSFLLSVALAEGSEDDSQQICPAVHLPPGMPGTCTVSHHCSKVTCVLTDPQQQHTMTIIVQINRCHSPLRAKVTLIQPEYNLNWSHRFQDGDKAKLPVTPGSITGMAVSDVTMYLKVGLKQAGGNVNFTLYLVGSAGSTPVNVTLLKGEMSPLAGECGEDQESHSVDSQDADLYKEGEYFDTEECRGVYLRPDLVKTCNISERCSKLTCAPPSEEKLSQTLTFKVNTCQYPPTATVTYKTPAVPTAWSHTFKNGEQAKMPVRIPGFPSGAAVTVFFKVTLNTTEDRVNFLLQLITQSGIPDQGSQPVSVVLLQGGLPLQPCNEEHHVESSSGLRNFGNGKCPRIQLPPTMPGLTCAVSSHCSKVKCTMSDGVSSHKLTITVKINKCHGLVTADVSFKQRASDLDWSHTFKDGEKAKLPTGTGMGASGMEMYLKVALKKTGRYLSFELRIMGQMKTDEVASAVNMPLLVGKVPFASLKCDGDAWFRSQPDYIKALVISGPILFAVLLVAIALFCCLRRRSRPLQFNVRSPPGDSYKVRMQPLINEA